MADPDDIDAGRTAVDGRAAGGDADPAGSRDAAEERTATLSGPVDFAGFRRAARALLAAGVAPGSVRWRVDGGDAPGDLFVDAAGDAAAGDAARSPLHVPRSLLALAADVVLHRDDGRFELLYRLLWRLQQRELSWDDTLDADRLLAETMARAVRRDLHKMKAFVRFRPISRGDALPPMHVAWFEPEHHVVEAIAPFFVGRFTQMAWTILTPRRSLSWDGERLAFAGGARREDAPGPDAGESLWLTYYANIFNPARLKLRMMRKEMPVRYWKNLPEAMLITPLAAAADARSGAMIERGATAPARHAAAARTSPPERGRPPAVDAAAAGGDADAAPADAEAAIAAARAAAEQCTRCPLYRDATQVVFGEGPARARLMVVGEQPGDQEDLQGRPFVGPSGRLLDGAFDRLGLDRSAVYVTNAVKHFKFEMRGRRRIHKTPAQQEVAACIDWLEHEIATVAPDAIVALGATAARALLGRPVAVMRERGRWLQRPDGIRVLVTLHPSALLRLPDGERDAAVERWVADLGELTHAPPAAPAGREAPRDAG